VAAMTAITPTLLGTVATGVAVSASDTIAQALLGPRGAYLDVINAGGSPDTVAISDAGLTPAGNSAIAATDVIAAGTSQTFYISPTQVNPATGLITVTHSFTTTVTYKLFPNGL
jgi:hypothetical protein